MDQPVETTGTNRAVRHRRRVLFAEDAQELGTQIAHMLTEAGWDVERARDASGLLHAVASPAGGVLPDVVLLDPLLAGSTGLDLVTRLHGSWPNVPVVLLATRGAEISQAQAKAVGASGVVPRPVDGVALGALLARTVVEGHRKRVAGIPPGQTAPPPSPAAFLTAVSRLERRGPVVGDRRVEERFPLRAPRGALLHSAAEEHPRVGAIRDVSSRGVLVRHSGAALPIGTRVVVDFDLQDSFLAHRLKVPATVRWTQWVKDGADAGVEFEDPEAKDALKAVFNLLSTDE